MNFGTENMLQQLCGFAEPDSVSIEEIETACARYPYYAPLQLLLAYRYRQQSNAYYTDQAEKTSVYFSNWYWLNELLEGKVSFSKNVEAAVSSQQADIYAASSVTATATDTVDVLPEASVSTPPVSMSAEVKVPEIAAESVEDPTETEEHIAEKDVLAALPTETADEQLIGEVALKDVAVPAVPELTDEIIDEVVEEPYTPAELKEDPVAEETFIEPVSEATALTEVAAITDAPKVEEVANSNDTETTASATGEDEDADPRQEPTALPGIEEMKQNIGLLKNVLSDLDNGSAPLIPIEPLHTIDYFASQGIKLKDLGIEPTDQLGRKLKSFTEWLKTMKKLHPEKLGTGIDDKSQSSIQHMAEHSNTVGEVLTESIAEVYARQGLKEKAREVYLKLSLQNPSKSTYFAAKIFKLNEL